MRKIRESKYIFISNMIALVASVIFIAFVYFSFNAINKSLVTSAKEQIRHATNLSKMAIENRIQGDFQTLDALSGFLEFANMYDENILKGYLIEENKKNNFIYMGFINMDSNGFITTLNGEVFEKQYDMNYSFIKKAMNGNTNISEVTFDELTQTYVCYYASPVYQNGNVVGVLTATNDASVYRKVLDSSASEEQGYANIIDQDGNFVVRSIGMDEDNIKNIFDGVIDAQKYDDFSQTLQQRRTTFLTHDYQGEEYWSYVTPLAFNHWNVYITISKNKLNESYNTMVDILTVGAISIATLLVFIFLYLSYMMKKNRKSLHKLAYYDSLTGAFNSVKFMEEAKQKLSKSSNYALGIINISNFKFINELVGYAKGDEILNEMKKILSYSLSETELYARFNGDRFVFLMSAKNYKQVQVRVERILQNISNAFAFETSNYVLVCHCGLKYLEGDSDKNIDVLIDRANIALEEARGFHNNTVVCFDETLYERLKVKNRIENTMRQALDNGEFQVYLQPKYLIDKNHIVGAEALVRWMSEGKVLYYPDSFIPIFEKNGFLVNLDLYMFEKVCEFQKRSIDEGKNTVSISINQTRLLFYQHDYVETLQAIVNKYQIPANLISIEVTESITVGDISHIKEIIENLHRIGFHVSLDDFGSGFSSLNVLKELSFDILKFDKVFLQGTTHDEKRYHILKNMLQMAKDLHVKCVVEGVETKEQVDMLRGLGCRIVQGYYYAKPMPVREFEQLLAKQNPIK